MLLAVRESIVAIVLGVVLIFAEAVHKTLLLIFFVEISQYIGCLQLVSTVAIDLWRKVLNLGIGLCTIQID